MMRGIADPRGEFVEADRVLGRLDQRDRLGHRDPVAPDLVGLAAQAGAIARGARGVGIGIEDDMLALGPPRGARRLAVDAGGGDRADHAPVVAAVARLEGGPGGVVVDLRHGVGIGDCGCACFPAACGQTSACDSSLDISAALPHMLLSEARQKAA